MLKKPTSGVLVVRRTRRTKLYASFSSLPAALLDGLFEHSPFVLMFYLICQNSWHWEIIKIFNMDYRGKTNLGVFEKRKI